VTSLPDVILSASEGSGFPGWSGEGEILQNDKVIDF
jgi:hypothetical protein